MQSLIISSQNKFLSFQQNLQTRMGFSSDYSFAVTFSQGAQFMWCLEFCSCHTLDVTDSIIGQERAIVFYDITAFMVLMNEILKHNFDAKLHIINNTAP